MGQAVLQTQAVCVFDTARQTYTEVPIKYPHIYSLNSYGNANNIVYTASGDRLFYGANASPDLFVYSFKDKSQKHFILATIITSLIVIRLILR